MGSAGGNNITPGFLASLDDRELAALTMVIDAQTIEATPSVSERLANLIPSLPKLDLVPA